MARTTKNTPAAGTALPFNTANGAEYPVSKLALGGPDDAFEAIGGAGAVGPDTQRMTLANDDVLVGRFGALNVAAATDETAATGLLALLKGLFRDTRARLGATNAAAAADETADAGLIALTKAVLRDLRARFGATNAAAAADETADAGLIALTKALLREVRARLGLPSSPAWSGTGDGNITAVLKKIEANQRGVATITPFRFVTVDAAPVQALATDAARTFARFANRHETAILDVIEGTFADVAAATAAFNAGDGWPVQPGDPYEMDQPTLQLWIRRRGGANISIYGHRG